VDRRHQLLPLSPGRAVLVLLLIVLGAGAPDASASDPSGHSVARLWNEQLLDAIRIDLPKPGVHARNLFHLSVAMWDAWAAYDPWALGHIVSEKNLGTLDVSEARAEAISYAAYRVLSYRFPVGHLDANGVPCHPNAAISQAALEAEMRALGYDPAFTSMEGDSPAALGNRIGAAVIRAGQADGAHEGEGLCYPDATGYASVNPPLIFKLPGAGEVVDPNRWQPLAFDFQVTQNGIPIGASTQGFVGIGWGSVTPFALEPEDRNAGTGLYLDPGPPPLLGGPGDERVKAAIVELIDLSSRMDATQNDRVDVSPGALWNNTLGADDGRGHPLNPVTGAPYAPVIVNRADYQRVVADFWADGPRSETPPGHWNVLANDVADHPAMRGEKRLGGRGRVLDDLEWDVKVYLALNGAVHDAAIWAWGNKQFYDSSRPITLIRYMAARGQSSDPRVASYDPLGLPLVSGLIEVITPTTAGPGGRHEHLSAFIGHIAIRAWRGPPPEPSGPATGVGWQRGEEWMPYMQRNFVTPPFPGYTSGHSTFSRAAAEVMTAVTGTPFFPGGLASFVAIRNEFNLVERGPTETVELQWATYYDAADQAGVARRLGGIHPVYDDHPSRIAAAEIGRKAWTKAQRLYRESPRRRVFAGPTSWR
jgi:hypothetical protein